VFYDKFAYVYVAKLQYKTCRLLDTDETSGEVTKITHWESEKSSIPSA